ncbi:MAG: GNAT family protein [Pseudomonadota bacterium]
MDEIDDDRRLGWRVPGWVPPDRPARAPIAGRYCRLEPLVPAHAGALHAANSDPARWDYLPYGPFVHGADYATWVADMAASPDPLFFTVFPGDAAPAGILSYLRIAPEAGTIEIGHINFAPALARTPAATEAMVLLIRAAFEAGYRRVEWKCNALNAPSRRAARRLGLVFEGVFRSAVISKGRNRDSAWYAAIDTDWPALSAAYDHWLDPSNFDASGRQRMRLGALTAPVRRAYPPPKDDEDP